MHNKAFKKSARIVGECFVKDTLILTDNGLIPIQEIKNGDIVFTQKDKCKVTELYEMPEQELLKIKLKNGITNTVTKSQKFKVLTSQLGFEWKEAKDLKEDEYVVIKAEYPDITAYVPLGEINSRKICLNENIAYLIGQLLSDGWVEKGYNHGKGFRCCFSSSSYSVMAKVAMILEHEFGHSATIEIKDHEILSTTGQMLLSRMYNVRINKTIINELFTDVFKLKSANAYTKTIPLQFFTSPKPVIFSLISGMIDGDGSIHKDRLVIHYGSVSETMINQFQLLLQHLGIFSTKYSDTNMKEGTINGKTIYPNYAFHSLEIVGSFAQKLAKSLNLYEEKKAERIKSQLISEDVKASHYDEIPYAGKIIFEELSNSHIGSGWYKDAAMNKFRLGIKYPGGSKIRYSSDLKDKMLTRTQIISWNIQKKLNMLGSSLAKFINHILDDNIYFLQIEKIEKTLAEKTYDIQVENEHEFIANGVVSHNCLGKYHPHGDVAVYDSLVRIAQNFSLRYPLVDGQGNFGSQDGDNPAAQRYTEARLSKIAAEMLADIEKETVKFQPNFDASLDEPTVLPAKIPNLLINGSSGIAVGMATNIPPHNLHEVIDGVIRAIDNPEISAEELMGSIIAPDFPTGGIICGRQGIINAYKYGRGKIIIRARTQIEEKKKRQRIIITEIPYMVNKSLLIEHIADLIRDKKVNGISDIRDESDRDGMRIVIELKTDANSDVVINQLYKHSNLQTTFGVIMLALVNNIPKILTLKEMITNYIEYRKEIVTNRTKFELKKAQERVHILSGLIIALNDIDNIIRKIKASKDTQAATAVLIADFALSELQAKAILDMKLQRLASLEQQKIKDEYAELLKLISELESILASSQKLMGIIKKELHEISEKYSDKRKTQVADITLEESELDVEDLIVKEDMVITVTNAG
ncbi:hypothetical protein HYU06_01400, partial [Candidatus Woesearchaeota archaeon]|nr:hypothetical protein [Candidatus Woesearchaeota archaeon]